MTDYLVYVMPILAFITLKVNRVYNSNLISFWGGIPMTYKERIRSLREDHDLTQSFVASLINVGQRTYADYELG